jgi:hypothetical protein
MARRAAADRHEEGVVGIAPIDQCDAAGNDVSLAMPSALGGEVLPWCRHDPSG